MNLENLNDIYLLNKDLFNFFRSSQHNFKNRIKPLIQISCQSISKNESLESFQLSKKLNMINAEQFFNIKELNGIFNIRKYEGSFISSNRRKRL